MKDLNTLNPSGIVAFMPLRGGSKSIPYKNIKLIAGKPLFYWNLKSAFDSGVFDAIYVSTDDAIIRKKVLEYLPKTIVIDRPAKFATDTATTESAMMHFAETTQFSVVSLIQATSPLTSAEDFKLAWSLFVNKQLDSLVTGVEWKRFFWKADGTPVNYDPMNRPRRQEFDGWIMENGAFYFTSRNVLLDKKCRLGGKMGVYKMPDETSLEIDEPNDWVVIEHLLKKRSLNNNGQKVWSNIKALVVDVDGTLTDGGMYYDKSGESLKKFNTKDTQGMKLLESKGIKIGVITAEDSPRVHSRMNKLDFDEYHFGIKNKLPLLRKLCYKWNIGFENVAYIGDDYGDFECIQKAGIGVCPKRWRRDNQENC